MTPKRFLNQFCELWIGLGNKIQNTVWHIRLTPEQNSQHFADNFVYILMQVNICILIQMPLKFIPKGQIDDNFVSDDKDYYEMKCNQAFLVVIGGS